MEYNTLDQETMRIMALTTIEKHIDDSALVFRIVVSCNDMLTNIDKNDITNWITKSEPGLFTNKDNVTEIIRICKRINKE